ncbi:MAG TPA: TIM-barrel domain-containing protein [Polyangiaceae bacterium]|nr:TIM-barrel domain-containing protein [Polyangiaceae bacterium]
MGHRSPRLAAPTAIVCAVVAACDQGGSALAPAGQGGVDAGGGAVAKLGSDGSFVVASHGATVVSTLPGKPLLTRASDPSAPDAWHDPTQPHTDLAWSAVQTSGVTLVGSDDASGVQAFHLTVAQQPADTALLSLTLAADDGFYTGLGEHFDHVSARGRVSPMFLTVSGAFESGTNEVHVPVPLLVSSRGWGVFVASREAGAFDVAATDPGTVRVTFEGRTLDVWFFVDPDPLAVVARFNRLAGLPRPLPRWALSPIHWRHWASPDDVLSIAQAYRTMHIPSSALWFDDGWEMGGYNTFEFDTSKFGDVAAMMQKIAALGFRVLAWTTPYLEQPHGAPTDEAQQLYRTAAANHWFVEGDQGDVYVSPATPIKGGAGIIDFTNAGAQRFWESLVSRGTAAGLQGFKCDYGEELIPNLLGARNPVRFSDGTTSRTARVFPIEEHATYHAALDAAYPGDSLIIARASAWGGATQADVIWPGDLDPGFEHQGDTLPGGSKAVGGLPAVVIDVQTLAASGFPAFGSDTAGYRSTPTEESMRRWMEHTALTPVMQVYEDGSSRLPWAISADAGSEYQAMATLHQQLEPYQAMLQAAAATTGTPPVRALPLAFPADTTGFARADDEYMLGPDLLVAPVVEAGASSRKVHLPPGRWVHWWSDSLFAGGTDVTVQAPLGQPPLFARAGGLVPMLPPDVDTLVSATAPGVVTLASRATELQARAWAAGPASVTVDDGSRIALTDDAKGVTITWAPGVLARTLTIDVDVRDRTGGSPALTTVEGVSGAPPAGSIANGHAHVTLNGPAVARIR